MLWAGEFTPLSSAVQLMNSILLDGWFQPFEKLLPSPLKSEPSKSALRWARARKVMGLPSVSEPGGLEWASQPPRTRRRGRKLCSRRRGNLRGLGDCFEGL